MPQPSGAELEAVRARRAELKDKYLLARDARPATTVRGVHHLALIAATSRRRSGSTRTCWGFRWSSSWRTATTQGSSHFFFDIGNRNLLGFFDFPGHDHPDFSETIGAVQHLALSTSPEEFAAARKRLDEAGIPYIGPDRGIDNSLYIRDPNGVGIEFYSEELGLFEGEPLLSS